MKTFKDFLTIKEAAEFLGVTTTTLRNWDRRGKLVPVRHPLNGYRLYPRSDLEELLKSLGKGEE
jgi:excisionase family DNA binding protein